MLDEDDPILSRFGFVMLTLENLRSAMNDELKTGTPIDPDQM